MNHSDTVVIINRPPSNSNILFTSKYSANSSVANKPKEPAANRIADNAVKTWPAFIVEVFSRRMVCSSGLPVPAAPASTDAKTTPYCVVAIPQKQIPVPIMSNPANQKLFLILFGNEHSTSGYAVLCVPANDVFKKNFLPVISQNIEN